METIAFCNAYTLPLTIPASLSLSLEPNLSTPAKELASVNSGSTTKVPPLRSKRPTDNKPLEPSVLAVAFAALPTLITLVPAAFNTSAVNSPEPLMFKPSFKVTSVAAVEPPKIEASLAKDTVAKVFLPESSVYQQK